MIRVLPKQGRKCALGPVAYSLFLIKTEGWWRTEAQPITTPSLLSGSDLELPSVFQGPWMRGWLITQGMSWLAGCPDLRKGQASSAVEGDSCPYSCFSTKTRNLVFDTLANCVPD